MLLINIYIGVLVNCSDRKWRQRTLIWKAPAENTEFPPMESFTLSKEMVKKVAKDNVIVVSYCNYALMDLMMNWVQHLNDVGVYNIIIGGLDRKVVEDLYWKGVPVFEMARSLNLTTEDVGWGSAGFGKIARQRVSVLNVLLTYGYEILMCDTDVVWLKVYILFHIHLTYSGSNGLIYTDPTVLSLCNI